MITDAILWVSNPALIAQRVGGLTVLERQLHTLNRAGLRRVWISTDQPAAASRGLRPPAGLEIFWINRGMAADANQCRPPYIVISGNHFIRIETLAHIILHSGSQHTTFLDARQSSVVQVVASRAEVPIPDQKQNLPEGASLPLQHPVAYAQTLDWLLAGGVKNSDGFMARHFDRHISLAVSRALLDTMVTPNMMTAFSCLVGLSGTMLFLIHPHTWPAAHLTGALLVWLHSVLDGCDGELARIRFQESALGADLDFWGDNLVHVSLFACLSVCFARADQSVLPLIAGLIATAGILGSAFVVFRQRLARRRAAGIQTPPSSSARSWIARVETILEQRDFIYLLVVLAYFGRTYEFMWAGAVGVVLFFAMTLYIGRAYREQAFQPHRAG